MTPTLSRNVPAILLASLLTAVSLAAMAAEPSNEPVTVDEQDKEGAARRFGQRTRMKLENFTSRHADGVRGYSSFTSSMRIHGSRPEDRPRALRTWSCNAAAFGLAVAENAQSFVGKNDIGVFTKIRFRVVDDWRANAQSAPYVVHLIVEGGEAIFAGERFRVENQNGAFQIKASYILLAGTRFDADQGPAIYGNNPSFIEVKDNRIYPSADWTLYPAGTAVQQLKTDLAKAVPTLSCD